MVGDVPLSSSYVPVIVTVPTATAVTVPDDDTVATPVLLDDQLGVTVAVVHRYTSPSHSPTSLIQPLTLSQAHELLGS
jgi:hypothetical protein